MTRITNPDERSTTVGRCGFLRTVVQAAAAGPAASRVMIGSATAAAKSPAISAATAPSAWPRRPDWRRAAVYAQHRVRARPQMRISEVRTLQVGQ
jgi:hypothetical protein